MSGEDGSDKFRDTGVEVASQSNLATAFAFRNAGVYYALLSIAAIFTVWSSRSGRPFYVRASNLELVLEQAATPVAIIAVGMAVLLISGNFDLSVASNAALSAMFIGIAISRGWFDIFGAPWLKVVLVLLLGVTMGTLGGLINGAIHWFVGLNSFIVTLGTLTSYRGLTLLLSGRGSVGIRNNAENEIPEGDILKSWVGGELGSVNLFLLLGIILLVVAAITYFSGRRKEAPLISAVAGVLAVVLSLLVDYSTEISHKLVVLAVLLLCTWVVMSFTSYGRRLYAVGGNLESAKASGINVALYRIVPFAFVGFCCGLAAITYMAEQQSIEPNLWFGRELWVIASAIIGGISLLGGAGSVLKTMAGALLLYTLQNGFQINGIPTEAQEICIGLLVVVSAAAYVVAERRAQAKGKI